jgi:hypothetical protein
VIVVPLGRRAHSLSDHEDYESEPQHQPPRKDLPSKQEIKRLSAAELQYYSGKELMEMCRRCGLPSGRTGKSKLVNRLLRFRSDEPRPYVPQPQPQPRPNPRALSLTPPRRARPTRTPRTPSPDRITISDDEDDEERKPQIGAAARAEPEPSVYVYVNRDDPNKNRAYGIPIKPQREGGRLVYYTKRLLSLLKRRGADLVEEIMEDRRVRCIFLKESFGPRPAVAMWWKLVDSDGTIINETFARAAAFEGNPIEIYIKREDN